MCGRYVRRSDKQKIAEWFKAKNDMANLPMPDADYNIAPTTHQPIIRQSKETNEREMVLARWGLVPFFTKELSDIKGLTTINARSETIATAKTWREPMKKRRCIIPASAFYEWPKEGKPPKQPYAFEISSGNLFAFAGLWDAWKDKDGHWLQSFAIVTTGANELTSCQGRSKSRPVRRSKSRPVDGFEVVEYSGEEGRWSVAEAALLPRGAFGGGRVSGRRLGCVCGGFA
jgi:putative SOS response-associated peptidase YedK